jgi:hypothetical protein
MAFRRSSVRSRLAPPDEIEDLASIAVIAANAMGVRISADRENRGRMRRSLPLPQGEGGGFFSFFFSFFPAHRLSRRE